MESCSRNGPTTGRYENLRNGRFGNLRYVARLRVHAPRFMVLMSIRILGVLPPEPWAIRTAEAHQEVRPTKVVWLLTVTC